MAGVHLYLREIRPTLTLAAPIIVGQVSQMLMGVMDSAMIGHAGTVPLAASAFANNVFHIFCVVGIAQLLLVGAAFQMADGVQVISAHLLRGISDVRVPTVITLVAYWGIALPLAYVIGVRGPFGATGIWAGIASGLGFAAVFLTVRFARLTR